VKFAGVCPALLIYPAKTPAGKKKKNIPPFLLLVSALITSKALSGK
jgi:hypothetical protein